MAFDGFLIPDWAKPYVGWVVGMNWPEGDETRCFRLADACVSAAYQIVEGTGAERPWSADKIGDAWDGAAHLAFAEHVARVTDPLEAEPVTRLIDTAIAINNIGVQIQYAKYMIEATVWLLILQLGYLLAIAVTSSGASLALIPARLQLARMTIAQIAKRTLANIAIFAGIVAGMDAGIQLTQIAKGRRDDLDGRQLVMSALAGGAMGGLMGGLTGGLTRLATPALRAGLTRAEMTAAERLLAAASSSIYGQAAQYAVTGGITTAGSLLSQGNFSWDLFAKGFTSSALGADGQHLGGLTPGGGEPPAHPTAFAPPSGPTPHGPAAGTGPVIPSMADTPPGHGSSLSQADVITPKAPPPQEESVHAPRSGQDAPATVVRPHALPGDDQPSGGRQRQERGAGPEPAPRTGDAGRTQTAEPQRAPRAADRTEDGGPGVPRGVDRGEGSGPGGPRGADHVEGGSSRPAMPGDAHPPGRLDQILNHGGRPETPDGHAVRAPEPPVGHAVRAPEPDALHAVRAPETPDGHVARAPETPDGHAVRASEPDALHAAVPDERTPGERTPAADVPTRSEQLSGTDTPPPASSGAHVAGTATSSGVADSAPGAPRAPFEFERFFNDPRWAAEATQFEQRLGAYYFNDPQTADAARTAVSKLRDVLLELTPRKADESYADLRRRVESAFFRDDEGAHSSVGQVGTRVRFDDLLEYGNVRELVTAFYNASYFNHDNPQILGKLLLDIIDNERWAEARAAGLDVGELRRMQRQLDDSLNRAIMGRLENWFDPAVHRFDRDPFGTGNVLMVSEHGLRNVADVVQSQASRHDRTPEEQQRLGLITTPEHYQALRVPLGMFERAFVERIVGEPLRPDTLLPWREGVTAHETTSSRWARRMTDDGFPVIDGVSATTTRMLTAAKFLDLGGATNERFLGALMGWMLPGRDHSLFEIIRGAQIAGLGRLDVPPGARLTPVDMYRGLPGLDLRTLRAEVLSNHLFPHEARYLQHADNPNGFSETQQPGVRHAADEVWPQLYRGKVTNTILADWLQRHGIDPTDTAAVRQLADRLSPAHVMALTVYTMDGHYLINNVTRTQLWTGGVSEAAVRVRMAQKAESLTASYLDSRVLGPKTLPLPLALIHALHTGTDHYASQSPLNALSQAYVDAVLKGEIAKRDGEEHREAGRAAEARKADGDARDARKAQRATWTEIRELLKPVMPRLFDEMRWHADMMYDAMMQLPTLGTPEAPVRAYRGDWITPGHSPIYGSQLYPHGSAREFLSASRRLAVGLQFMADNPSSRKVLVVYQLTGQQARDISVFSAISKEQEVILPPHSRARRIQDPELVEQIRKEVERLTEDMKLRLGPDDYEIIVMEEG
ncbi:WXG100-like domain-containing protein [Streptosporangium soli]|nr:hypothetical protein [Streptosporangium sp. KLBMP 9127]